MTDSPRRRARELVLQSLYAEQCGGAKPTEDFRNIVGEEKLPERARTYARQLLKLVYEHQDWADSRIEELVQNWVLSRIAAVDLNILRMAMVELEYVVDVPVKVVLNEAIELAKKFSTNESSSFVNGVLDKFVQQMEESH